MKLVEWEKVVAYAKSRASEESSSIALNSYTTANGTGIAFQVKDSFGTTIAEYKTDVHNTYGEYQQDIEKRLLEIKQKHL